MDFKIPSIRDSIDYPTEFPTVTERYFTPFYFYSKIYNAQRARHEIFRENNENNPLDITKSDPSDITENNSSDIIEKDLSEVIEKNSLDITEKNPSDINDKHPSDINDQNPSDTNDKNPLDINEKQFDLVENSEATCVLVHSNRLCVITVSPKHPVLTLKKEIVKVDFDVKGGNRLENKVSGKGKRGGQNVLPQSLLCYLICGDGTSYKIHTGAKGRLVEVNRRLLRNPSLISMHPQEEGYLAVVLPHLTESDKLKRVLLSEEEYNKLHAS